jgi:methyl-accepting chemotaxis protein
MATHHHSRFTIGIIGGGKVGVDLFEEFYQSSLTEVAYLVDINPQAPGLLAARKCGVPTFTNLDQALSSRPVHYILEVTGSQKVYQLVLEKTAGSDTSIINSNMAYVILGVINENSKKSREHFVRDISTIHGDIEKNLVQIDSLVDSIESITMEMRILALNARIEAARAGEVGKGFGVVAEQMTHAVDTVHDLTEKIVQVNTGVKTVADKIESSLKTLN